MPQVKFIVTVDYQDEIGFTIGDMELFIREAKKSKCIEGKYDDCNIKAAEYNDTQGLEN